MVTLDKLEAFDVESWGAQDLYALQPFRVRTREAWLTSCAMARYRDGKVETDGQLRPDVLRLAVWLGQCAEEGRYVVCWNAPFDVAWLIALGLRELVFKVKWLDALILQRHILNEPRFRPNGRLSMGLKETVARIMPEHAGYNKDVTFNPQTPEEWDELLTYNKLDAGYTLNLAWRFLKEMTDEQRRNALIEAASIPLVAESIVEGVGVNVAAAETLKVKLTEDLSKALMVLRLTEPTISEKVLASPKQLGDLLFKTWGLPVLKLTDTGNASTDRETLTQLALTDARAMHVNTYREAKGNLTKFVEGPLASAAYNGDGQTRPQARIFGTYTGRMTYSSKTGKGVAEVPTGVALHQWKRDADFRRILTVDDDEELLEFDFAGQEFRWMAVESGDPTMLKLCQPGEDAHAFMGGRCTGVSYQDMLAGVAAGDPLIKPKRQFGKVANLSCQYRTSAKTLVRVAAVQHKIKLTDAEAHNVWLTYRQTYKKVPKYWKRQISKARQLGYIETLAGRRITLGHPDTWVYNDVDEFGEYQDASWSHESTAINFPIQGIGADQKYLAMRVLKDYLPQVDGRFAFELHDGLFVRVPKRYADRAVREIKHLLSNLPYKKAWGVDLPIQFPVDAKRGPTWGDLKEVKEWCTSTTT